jgi:Na+/pantothenate symporter
MLLIFDCNLKIILFAVFNVKVNLYSGHLFLKVALGWDLYVSVLFILAVTAFSTITGGLAAVIYTDTLQAIIMVFGGMILMIIAFTKVGSYNDLMHKYMNAIPDYTLVHQNISSPYASCGLPSPNSFRMLRDINDPNMPWLGFLMGQTTASIWYWCSDQVRQILF